MLENLQTGRNIDDTNHTNDFHTYRSSAQVSTAYDYVFKDQKRTKVPSEMSTSGLGQVNERAGRRVVSPFALNQKIIIMKNHIIKDYGLMGNTINKVLQDQINNNAEFRDRFRAQQIRLDNMEQAIERIAPGRMREVAEQRGQLETIEEIQVVHGPKILAKIEALKKKPFEAHVYWIKSEDSVRKHFPGTEYDQSDIEIRKRQAIAQDAMKLGVQS